MRNSLSSLHTVNAIDKMTCLVPEFNLHSLRGRQLRTVHLGCNRLFHPPEVHLAGVYCPTPGTEVPLRLSSQSASLSTSEDHTDREEASQHELGPAVCGKSRATLSHHRLIARKLSHPLLGIWDIRRNFNTLYGHCRVPREMLWISPPESV